MSTLLTEATIRDVLLRELQDQIEFAYLLGSAGTPRFQTTESDVDLAVFWKTPAPDFSKLSAIRTRLEQAWGCDVDLVPLNDVDLIFGRQVLETGRLLACESPGELLRWKAAQLSAYPDFKYSRAIIEKCILGPKINVIKNCLMAIEKAARQEMDEDFRLSIYELNLQRAIQACIDLANTVLAREGLGLPNSYRQAFELLQKHSVVSAELGGKLVAMVGFRNISVHDYEQIKPEIVHGIVKDRLVDFEAFYTLVLQRAQKWE